MPRLPTPGSDKGTWGDILNDYLSQSHKGDGTLKDDVVGSSQLQDNSVTNNVIAPNSVTSASLATDAVNSAAIADGSVAEAHLASAVQTKLNAGPVIADGSIAKTKLETTVKASLDKADASASQTDIDDKLTTTDLDSATAVNIAASGSETQTALDTAIGAGIDGVIEPGATDTEIPIWDAVDGIYKPGPQPSGSGGTTDFAPLTWAFMSALEVDQQNLVLAFSGDSTMVVDLNWPYFLTTLLAARYPKYTFTFKGKTPSVTGYNADINVQTGTGGGGHTVTVYNWSSSGIGTGTGMLTDAELHVAFPIKPDLLLIGTGQNDVSSMGTAANQSIHRRQVRDAIALFAQHYPQTPAVFVLPNPRTAADANYDELLLANQIHVEQAGTLGLGVIDLTREWLTRAGGYASLMGDATHPNTAGSQFSAGKVLDKMVAALDGPVVPTALSRLSEEIWIPTQGAFVHTGTPAAALQATYGNAFGFAFDDTAVETIILPMVHIPWWWERIRCHIMWCPQTGNVGIARWAISYARGAAIPGVLDTMGLSTFPDADVVIATNQLGRTQVSQIQGDSPAHTPASTAHTLNELSAPYAPMQFRVSRNAAHANDTLTGDALVYAIRLSRG